MKYVNGATTQQETNMRADYGIKSTLHVGGMRRQPEEVVQQILVTISLLTLRQSGSPCRHFR